MFNEEGCAIQVAYALGDAEERQTKGLISFAEKTEGVKKLIIVTNEEERNIERDGYEIEVIPIHKFLLRQTLNSMTI